MPRTPSLRSQAIAMGFGACFHEKFFLNSVIWCVLEHIFINFLKGAMYKVFHTISPSIF